MRTIAKITFACLLAAVVRSDQPTKFLNEKNEPAYPAGYGGEGSLGPAWTRGEIERPKGTEKEDTYTREVYTKSGPVSCGGHSTTSCDICP